MDQNARVHGYKSDDQLRLVTHRHYDEPASRHTIHQSSDIRDRVRQKIEASLQTIVIIQSGIVDSATLHQIPPPDTTLAAARRYFNNVL